MIHAINSFIFFKHINRESHWYTRKVKEAIRTRLSPNNINRDNGAEIPEACFTTLFKISLLSLNFLCDLVV